MYDYYLGGKDNYAADRRAAENALEVFPEGRQLARANRDFMVRAVRYCADQGIDQFIDIGTGIPTFPNVADVAREVNPRTRMVGVDNDPVVLSYDRALVETDDGVRIVDGNMCRPQEILADPVLNETLDLTRPVAVLMISVLHFVADEEDPAGIVAAFREPMAPGSLLVISAATSNGSNPDVVARIQKVYEKTTSAAAIRPAEQILAWFDGLDLVPPGLVDVSQWPSPVGIPTAIRILGGVGRKQ